MNDIIDRANALAEKQLEVALANQLRKTTACSLTHCEECDEPIPEARRKQVQGCTRCVECQHRVEQRQKHYRRAR